MAKLFDMNNPVWRFMGKIADMFLLTLAWFVCSVPIITIGASTTALYYVSLKMEEGKEGYLFQTFWETFKKYIKQSTGIWLIVLAVGAFLCGDFYICYQTDFPAAKMMSWIFLVFGVVYLLVVTVLFPLAARLDTGIGKMFFMAFMISLKNFACCSSISMRWASMVICCRSKSAFFSSNMRRERRSVSAMMRMNISSSAAIISE